MIDQPSDTTSPETRTCAKEMGALLAKLRDCFIVLSGLSYALGFLVWCYHHVSYGLGPPSAFEFQYLIAGIPVAGACAVVWCSVRWLSRALHTGWARWISAQRVGTQRVISLLLLIALCSLGFVAFPLVLQRMDWLGAALTVALLVTILIVDVMLQAVPQPSSRSDSVRLKAEEEAKRSGIEKVFHEVMNVGATYRRLRSRFEEGLVRRLLLVVLPVMAAVGCFWFSAEKLYPLVPQGIGGARPRCVVLDVDTGQVTRETMVALGIPLGDPQVDSMSGVRSEKVAVFSEQNGRLLILVDDETRVLELSSSAVRAMATCDRP